MDYTYKIEEYQKTPVISLSGRLIISDDSSTLHDEVTNLIQQGKTTIICDLSNLEYINSSGLNLLVNILTKVRNMGGDLALCCLSKKIQELLLITKLNTVFVIAENIESAAKLIIT